MIIFRKLNIILFINIINFLLTNKKIPNFIVILKLQFSKVIKSLNHQTN